MKKSILLNLLVPVIVVVFISSYNIYAQEAPSAGPIPAISGNTDHVHYGTGENAMIGYGHESQSTSTISMPIPAGTPFTTLNTFIPPGGGFASSMIKGPDGNYYLTTNAPSLYQFNPGTGAVTLLGAITGMAGQTPNGISYNPANGQYYLASSSSLFSFDVSTRVATLIGAFGVAGGLMIDLCFDLTGTCYAYDLGVDNAYTVNISTGAATLLGPLGYDANFGQGMAYDFETSTIYLSAFNNGSFSGQLRTMNPATGMTTLVTDWGLQQVAPFALDTNPIPVELTSFTASVTDNDVILNWTTASEINNHGFEVQKMLGNEFYSIGFVTGYGTTTEVQSYSFVDRKVASGTHSYRLKQVDFDGGFEYSEVIEVDATVPDVYSLAQNYPNPFNPTTKIEFGLAVDSRVNLKVFNILGQLVAEIIDANMTVGFHEIDFDASALNSGVYFYTLEALGIDGTNFVQTRKMILTK
jgi:hypothetical protein